MKSSIDRFAILLLSAIAATSTASAGRPLVVDDIEPTSHEAIAIEVGTAADLGAQDRWVMLPLCVAWGALPDFELSAFTVAHMSSPAPVDARGLGVGDIGIGVKWRLLGSDAATVGFALTAAATAPTGHAGFSAEVATGDLMVVSTWSKGPTCIDLNLGYALSASSAEQASSSYFHGGLAVRHQASDAAAVVAELYGDAQDGVPAIGGTGAGIQYTLDDSTWLDGAIGAGFTGEEVRFLLTVGVTTVF